MSIGIWAGFLIGGLSAAVLFGRSRQDFHMKGAHDIKTTDWRKCVWCDRRLASCALNCSAMDEAQLYGLPERHRDPVCQKILADLRYTIEDGLARGVLRRDGSRDSLTE